ncbi:MAG: hypothetical protein IPM06_21730 [Rhizobiales bacterium]|nr:hypothetical protein [Hyphomicrobiales bacterium]MBK8773030.1 hypothetical protein [Hyphomicrobiales bacterium]
MTPWQEKNNIDVAFGMADRNGFRLIQDHNYGAGMICLQTKGGNEHGFANDITLQTFEDWKQAVMFLAGWEKHELAVKLGKVKK